MSLAFIWNIKCLPHLAFYIFNLIKFEAKRIVYFPGLLFPLMITREDYWHAPASVACLSLNRIQLQIQSGWRICTEIAHNQHHQKSQSRGIPGCGSVTRNTARLTRLAVLVMCYFWTNPPPRLDLQLNSFHSKASHGSWCMSIILSRNHEREEEPWKIYDTLCFKLY